MTEAVDALRRKLAATEAISRAMPEPIREHWVDIEGRMYPAKQAYQLVSHEPRSTFTSHQALARLRKLGFVTSRYEGHGAKGNISSVAITDETPAALMLSNSFSTLVEFLGSNPLTKHIADAEADLEGANLQECTDTVGRFAFSDDLLDAALAVRKHAGRISDVIHATVIARCLPLILEPTEVVKVRPSLGAGNDPGRPFDLETDLRIAEFKVSQWKGADTTRKRSVFTDLVHLALDDSGRLAQLFAVGPLPHRFLTRSQSSAAWALGRSSSHTRARFEKKFGPAEDMSVAEFYSGPANHVEIVDIATYIPQLALPDGLI